MPAASRSAPTGILIEQKLALGDLVVRIITSKSADALVDGLRSAHYGATTLDGHGATGPVQVILTMIKLKELPNVVAIVERIEPLAFYSVDELQVASRGVFPQMRPLRPEARGWRAVRSARTAAGRSA